MTKKQQEISQIGKNANELVENLESLYKEVGSFQNAKEELNKVTSNLLSFIDETKKLSLESHKIIDVISFEREGISIGAEIFSQVETTKSRIIHEFSSKVSMMLRYDNELEMIVFDHLSPARPEYENQFQFYGPDSSYDGLEFKNCVWTLQEDLNLINKLNMSGNI